MGKHTAITADDVAGIAAPADAPLEHHIDDLSEALADKLGYGWEWVGDATDGIIANVSDADGRYLYTLTMSRTPGC